MIEGERIRRHGQEGFGEGRALHPSMPRGLSKPEPRAPSALVPALSNCFPLLYCPNHWTVL